MAVEEGKFQLYARLDPPLEAGEWRLVGSQELNAVGETGALGSSTLRVDDTNLHFRVKAPRYLMPPDQVLSTFPPANSFGSYGSRLPQVVIKRRTLPWERNLGGPDTSDVPWLALVLIAEGEARLATGINVAECVTPGVTLGGIADVEKGNCLIVRKSVVDRVFPTQKDVPLLAHAREVDISDTELMMGDDDGFLAVVISNRLPLPGRDDNDEEAPVKYLACLVSLEGQFESLLPQSPDPVPLFLTDFVHMSVATLADASTDDHQVMGTASSPVMIAEDALGLSGEAIGPVPLAAPQDGVSHSVVFESGAAVSAGATPSQSSSQWSGTSEAQVSSTDVQLQMAQDFRVADGRVIDRIDPELRFPVLMHWSFTSTGSTTFESLMKGLDSGLLGDVGEEPSDLTGRLPLEVVESGHVGLGHKTREGDDVRSWYRGPLVPHPTLATTTDRLLLAHSSDQLRIVIQDGREDLSLASAFEVGRLLSLSQPSIIASLMRWRQGDYYAARTASMLEANRPFWESVLGAGFTSADIGALGPAAGRFLVDAIAANPETFLGAPRPAVTPGRPLVFEGLPSDTLATGLGLDTAVLRGGIDAVFEQLREVDVPALDLRLDDLGTVGVRDSLRGSLDAERIGLVSDALAPKLLIDVTTGPTFPAIGLAPVITPDVLDVFLSNPRPGDDAEDND